MPLTRYQIRNEYGLADPELYKAADKDDPEALLEGVAMAGLVGVLRQLGDLAEFAAEVFHDLHEEVISTAARGHTLMIRVQQLEAEVPSIEKAFLSQTNHTSFFTGAGLDWHPNLQSEQGLVARGDLPRFVMDSYEECRGPPRLFLLDKFDVAGAGACLKRYTDPSVFKVESKASERSNIEPQREKKNRKVKQKKGPRRRNGGTPEIGPTSHAKLHQLFLEERIDSCFNDPSRLVKLKKRQFNRCVNSKNGKSYMEKFLETPSPEHKMVYEASVAEPTLRSMSDNTNELGLRILDITMVSPASKSPGRVSTCSSCIAEDEELKRPINGGVSGEEILKMPESTADDEIETTPNLQMVVVENHLEYGEGKTGSSIDGYRSDEVISEVDNYVDALATMESEIETDNEPRSKNVNLGKQRSESDANAEHIEAQAQLSDSQSFVNSSGSDDGNSSFKRERSSFSCSDTLRSLPDNIQYDSEETAKVLPSSPKACMADIENMPCNTDYTSHSHESNADEHGVLDYTSVDEERISKPEVPGGPCFLDSISPQPLLDTESFPSLSLQDESKLNKKSSTNLINSGSKISSTETDPGCHKDVHVDVPSKTTSSADHTIPFESCRIRDREGEDVDATSENSLHLSNVLGQAVEIEAVEKVGDTMLQKEYQDDRTIDKQALPEIDPSPSSLFPAETSRASTNDSSDNKYNLISLKGDDSIVAAEAKYLPLAVDLSQTQALKDDNILVAEAKYDDLPLAADCLQTHDFKDQVENVAVQVEDGMTEIDVTYSERDANIVDIRRPADDGKVTTFTHADDTSEELQLCYPNDTVHEMHLSSRDFVETVNPEGVTLPSTSVSSRDVIISSGDLDHEDSVSYSNFATGKVRADEFVDSVNFSDVVTEEVQADEVVNSVNCSEIVAEKVLADEVVDSVNCSDVMAEKVQADKVVDSVTCSDVVTDKVRSDEMVESVDCSDVSAEVQGDGVVASTSIVAKTATIAEVTPKNLNSFSDEENVSTDKLHTGAFQADGFDFDADPMTRNDVNGVVSTSLLGLLSTSENMKSDLLENHPGFENPYQNQNELISDYPDSGLIDGIHNLPVHTWSQCTSVIDNLSFGPESLELRDLESELNSSHQCDLNEGIEFISPPSLSFSSAVETSSEPLPGLQAKHEDMGPVGADVDVSNSSRLEQPSPGQLDEEKVQLVQPSYPVQQDQCSKCTTIEATIQAGHSLSELYIQHPIGELDMTGRTMDTLQPVLPSDILLPEVPRVDLNEMPPLPPLPPMQWRLGKVHQAFPAPPRCEDPLHSILPSKAEEKSICLESENPYTCFQDNKLTHISGHMVHNTMQPPPFTGQMHMITNEVFEYSSATMEKQYNNPFFTLPPMPQETLELDSLKSGGEEVQADLKLPSLGPTNDDVNCKIDSGSSYGQSFQSFSNSASQIDLKPDIPQHVSQDSEGEKRNSHAMIAPLSFMKNEQSRDDLPSTEEEVASSSKTALMPSTSGVGMPNGKPPTSSKLLRPRSPLIDAVAAHDKSKLRKVSDRILPEIGPKVDERDSLLAQIRTKSFSLKPAAVTRPSVQGPKTNLRVAAILERANAIRQAFAGSDEDDDSDSWSDSE